MSKRIQVKYHGLPDEDLDMLITVALVNAGLVWYAQGFDYVKQERDITFEEEDDE